jgi:thiosulfate/3-mercaptopyruvate sulfurtransferase
LTIARTRLHVLSSTLGLTFLFSVAGTFASAPAKRGEETKPTDPWTSSQIVQASDLVHELESKSGKPPAVVYVGFHTLFAGGHIPGATFHGTASTGQGLAELKKWVDALPRTTNLVIYCGCCPLEKCPNIRPAFAALSEMGFTKLRVLALPTSFAADWADKGYPVQKGM